MLLDVMMPEMNGLEVLRELHARGLTEQVPVFMITAETGDEMMKEAYALGVMDVIGKPVVPYLVQRRVGSVVERFLKRFLQDETLSALKTALDAGDTEAAAAAAHSLKGTSGNLSLNILFERSTAQLRAGDLEGARQAMAGVTEACANAVEAIRAVYGEG